MTRLVWRTALVVAGLALSLLVAGLVGPANGAPAQAGADPDVPDLPARCNNYTGPERRPGACHVTPWQRGRPTLVLWGDSHAWQWTSALQAAVRGKGVNVVGFWWGACPPMRSTIGSPAEYDAATRCQQSNYLAARFVRRLDRRDRPMRVVLGGYWQLYRSALEGQPTHTYGLTASREYYLKQARLFRAHGPALFRLLGRRHIGTDVVGPSPVVPDPEFLPCQPLRYGCPYLRSRSLLQEAATRAWVRGFMRPLPRRSRLVDVAGQFCDERTCHGVRDGVYTFLDVVHISASASARSREAFAPSVRRLLRS